MKHHTIVISVYLLVFLSLTLTCGLCHDRNKNTEDTKIDPRGQE